MAPDGLSVRLSAIDEERFGIRTARAPLVTLETLPSVTGFCRANEVAFLIARCRTDDLAAAQAMEREGFALMDTLLYYTLDLVAWPFPSGSLGSRVRPLQPGEEGAVQAVAAAAFRGYLGHYHADARLDRAKCDETYASWALNACLSRDRTREVMVAGVEGRVAGFVALRLNDPAEGEVVLLGVDPLFQRRGIYRSLIVGGGEWCLSQGSTCMLYSTQIHNVVAQKALTRLGFELSHSYYTFHKWFEGP